MLCNIFDTTGVVVARANTSRRATASLNCQDGARFICLWMLMAAFWGLRGSVEWSLGAQEFPRAATFESGASSLALGEGSGRSALQGNLSIYFTTPDGLNRFPLAQNIGGNPYFSRELEYFPGNASPFVTDYVVFSSAGIVEYGTLRLTLQLADSNQDGIPDLLQRRFAGTGAFNGQAAPDNPAAAAFSVGGVMTREPGQHRGTYSLTLNSASAGRVVFAGAFSMVSLQGAMRFQRDGTSGRTSLDLVLTRPDGTANGFSGVTDFSVRTANQVAVNPMSLTNAIGQNIQVGGMVLNRTGNRYIGSLVLGDGDLVTSWVDYATHFVEVTDLNDSDNDSVPDLSSPYQPPAIFTQQPKSQSVAVSSSVTLSIAFTSASAASVQWRFNGVPLPGANANSLVLENLQLSQSGMYSAQVANRGGPSTSSNAVLAVLILPSITTQPGDQTVDAQSNARFAVVAAGSSPIRYQWRLNSTNLLSATNAILNLVKITDQMAGKYDVVVANEAGRATSSVARLTVNVPPSITLPPKSLAVGIGGAAVFRVGASGTAPLTYQWQLFGTNLVGANAAELRLSNVLALMSGPYQVRVSNRLGEVMSEPVLLTLLNRFVTGTFLPDRQFKLRVTGETGVKYALQSSADLMRWRALIVLPPFEETAPFAEFIDSTTQASPIKFYRAVPLP